VDARYRGPRQSPDNPAPRGQSRPDDLQAILLGGKGPVKDDAPRPCASRARQVFRARRGPAEGSKATRDPIMGASRS
jgi:hypothetical protein